jgi:hypothetical protein
MALRGRQPYIIHFTNAAEKKNAENVLMLKDNESKCMEIVDRYRGCLNDPPRHDPADM